MRARVYVNKKERFILIIILIIILQYIILKRCSNFSHIGLTKIDLIKLGG
jgi:hypothetical protein